MPIPIDTNLYKKVKEYADNIYKKPSAYKSGFIVKTYKEHGGRYIDDDNPKNLSRWFKENWKNIGNLDYPVYRPTKRVSKETPLTINEIDPLNLLEQIILKQKIKGDSNLPKFISKGGSNPKIDIYKVSNPDIIQKKAIELYGIDSTIYRSENKNKKYKILNTNTGKFTHFGDERYEDFSKHQDKDRRINYIKRASKIKGKWRSNVFSPNFLSLVLLWDADFDKF